jgi:hypothetical protein
MAAMPSDGIEGQAASLPFRKGFVGGGGWFCGWRHETRFVFVRMPQVWVEVIRYPLPFLQIQIFVAPQAF